MQKGCPYGLEKVETLSQVQKQVQEVGTGRIRKEREDQQQRLMERKGPTGECEEKKEIPRKNKAIKEGVIKKRSGGRYWENEQKTDWRNPREVNKRYTCKWEKYCFA